MLRHRFLGLVLFLTAVSVAGAVDTRLLPNDTEIVFTLNFQQILDSDVVKGQKDAIEKAKAFLENALPGDDQAMKYLKATGFDPFRDLTSVSIATPGGKDPDAIFLVVEGKFQKDKFLEAAKEAAKNFGDVLKLHPTRSHTILEITPPGEKRVYAALASDTVLLACPTREALDDSLARSTGGKISGLKKEVKDLLAATSSKQSLSFVATGPALAKLLEQAPLPGGQAKTAGELVKNIEGMSAALTITKDIQFELGVGTKDANTANEWVQGANIGLTLFVQPLVAKKAMEDPKLAPLNDVVKTIKATSKGSTFLLRGEVSMDNLEKLMKNFKK